MSSSAARIVTEPQVIFEATPKQDEFARAVFSGQYRYLAFGGAIRGGKTWTLLALLFALCRIYAKSRWAIVRKDLPTLRRNTIPSFNKLRPRSFVGPVNQSTWIAPCTNGSEIVFFPESLDIDPDLDRWKGLEVNGFALEEANELSKASFSKAIERAGAWIVPDGLPQPDPLVLLTFNPSPTWVKRVFYDPWKAGSLAAPYYFLPSLPSDNPHLPESYRESLKNLPESEYRRFVLGDWEHMTGAALPELTVTKHIVPAFDVPKHWTRFMAFDWGYRHPFSLGLYATNEEGDVWKLDTITGRGMQDEAILEYCRSALEARGLTFRDFRYTVAGGDCFQHYTARGGQGPPTAEFFAKHGWPLTRADDRSGSRVMGLSNFRRYIAWKPTTENGSESEPRFRWFETVGNRKCFEQCQSIMLDPDKPEEPLKANADENGDGGDDMFDETRYGLASRPLKAKVIEPDVRCFDPAVMAAERETMMTLKGRREQAKKRRINPNLYGL